MNFYPFHIGDYISHTSHLSDDEDLAYRRMIDLYYQTEKPFTQDPSWIAKRCKTSPEIIHYLLSEFFELDRENGCWRNKRADEEIAKYHAMQEGGRKGAAKRWGKGSDSPPIDTPMPTKNQEPRTNNHIIKAPEGVTPEVWNDFKKMRDKQRAPLTTTALKGLAREAEKAKMSLDAVMQLCCERGWRGFKAEWAKDQPTAQNTDKSWMFTEAGIIAKANELGVHSMGLSFPQLKEKILLVMAKKAMS